MVSREYQLADPLELVQAEPDAIIYLLSGGVGEIGHGRSFELFPSVSGEKTFNNLSGRGMKGGGKGGGSSFARSTRELILIAALSRRYRTGREIAAVSRYRTSSSPLLAPES